MKRKEFIHECGVACVGGAVLAAWLQSCSAQKPVAVGYENNQLVVPLENFKRGKAKWKRGLVVRHEKTGFPVAVFRSKEGVFRAFLLRCTHQGNELNVYGDLISCNAHGSEFSTTGEVLQGPAEAKLQSFAVNADNQNLYIKIV